MNRRDSTSRAGLGTRPPSRLLPLVTLLVAAALAVAGCGSSTPPNALQMAHQLGCPTAHYQRHPSKFAEHEVYCGDLDIAIFAGNQDRDRWLEVSSSFGGRYVWGDRWVIYARNTSQAQHVQSVIGGVVQ